ncbi:DMT family transporter [Pseudoroseomonas cervicalis]|uniref:DMT family transporter n=1 Tax=Teichococcus cervicalis TaxID=204525 RepID=UPI0022F17B22|nr:DMT family transporter [Pseudoroseomonas cervicalis]WBV44421.1 DMT family transporter [Pseudoroseomonas cervicalis]
MSQHVLPPPSLPGGWQARIGARWRGLPPTLRGMAWMLLSGLFFSVLNAIMSVMTRELPSFQSQFLRYGFGFLVMVPLLLRTGPRAYAPNGLSGQLWRGVVHTAGLLLWFLALPHIPLADVTALGFTGPIFIMIGAVVFLKEQVPRRRWIAAGIGLLGVAIVLGPKLSGGGGAWTLVMLASSPLFAASFLITKALTRRDRPEVIVMWQSITISLFTLPFALAVWVWPSPVQLAWFVLAGLLGTAGHWCLTEAFRLADVSATQPVKFLDLAWASAFGFLLFGDVPGWATLAGAVVIFGSASWMAREEARKK